MTRYRGTIAAALLSALTLAACSSTRSAAPSSTSSPSNSSSTTVATATATAGTTGGAAALQQDFVTVVNKVRPSVVEISTGSGLGSGVVLDTQGDIVTNYHVVGNSKSFQVTFFDGQTVPAALVGTFQPDDLAVIKVSRGKGVNPASFADSTKLQIGDICMAIGNPLGLSSSVTEGIVSFNGRTVPEGNGVVLPDTVQTSASINPGNSGGALVDINGQVIGIPTLAATDPQLGGSAAPGIGFAIPSNTAKLIAGQIVSQGKVTNSGRAALGIGGATAMTATGQPGGVIITSVQPGGPADKAGIKPGDVILKINGTPTPTLSDLQGVLAGLKPGDTASVTVLQPDGSQKTLQVQVADLTG